MTESNIAMDYEIIFYHSGSTSVLEQLLHKELSPSGMKAAASAAAFTPKKLVLLLSASLSRCDVVFIIGGLDGGKASTDTILSAVLSAGEGGISSDKLIDESGAEAYILRAAKQKIIVLPDDSEVVNEMLQSRIKDELKRDYALSGNNSAVSRPDVEAIAQELDKELSKTSRVRVTFENEYAKKEARSLKKLLIPTVMFAVAGVVLACLAVVAFFTA